MSLGVPWVCNSCSGSNESSVATVMISTLFAELVRSVGNALQPALAAAAEAAHPLAVATEPYVRPLLAAVSPYVRRLQPLTAHAVAVAAPHARAAAQWVNRQAGALEPWQLVLLTAVATLLVARLLRWLRAVAVTIQDKGEDRTYAAAPTALCRGAEGDVRPFWRCLVKIVSAAPCLLLASTALT